MKKVLIYFIGQALFCYSSNSTAQDSVDDEISTGGIDIILKIDGIDGESRIDNHEDEIDVLAWSWGIAQSGSMHVGGGGGAGMANVQDVSLTKYVDKASADLMLACFNGEHLKEAILTVRKSGDQPADILVITMSPVMVTSVSAGGSGGNDWLTENISLNFAKVNVSYTPQKEDGSADAAIDFTWNIEVNLEE